MKKLILKATLAAVVLSTLPLMSAPAQAKSQPEVTQNLFNFFGPVYMPVGRPTAPRIDPDGDTHPK